ncbi:MAG: type II secretion system F family protein [Thermoprotei archaeon]|nr:type II secretion system F family protein [Thermoprotei archaeon]
MNRNTILVVAVLAAGVVLAFILPDPARPVPIIVAVVISLLKYLLPAIRKRTTTYEIDDTLIYLITHMYAVSTGKPPRKRLFELQTIAGGYGEYDAILRRIATLAVEWSYGFGKAIRIVVRNVRNKVFRDFLMRLGELLNIGEDPERFLDVERRALLTEFQAHYGRIVEATKLLLGVYTSGVSSSMFMAITVLIFSLMFSSSPNIIIVVYMGIISALATLAYVLYRVLPRDRITHTLRITPPERRKYRILLIVGITASVAAGLFTYFTFNEPSLAMALGAIPVVIPGFYARRIEKKIREIESFFPIFIRSFGLTYATVPHVSKALASVLRSEYGALTRYLQRLLARLTVGVDPKIAWYHFIGETWSEVIRRNVNVLYDAIDAGGDLASVGTVLSETTFRILDIRKQRAQVSKAFESTTYIIHTLLSAVLSFILSLLNIFSVLISTIQEAHGELPMILPFQPIPMDTATLASSIFVLAVAVINAFAIKIAQGGMYETVWVPLGTLLAISGIVMFGVKVMSNIMFGQLLHLQETVSLPI